MILTGSRYFGQPVVTIQTQHAPTDMSDMGSVTSVAVFGPLPSRPNSFVYYRVIEGDRFDVIANKVYGVPDFWWRIADANPEIYYPDQLTPGVVIRIPAT
jgi:hypothetical protein